ncbi:myeloid-associated differentiation marker-like protein 2 [Megalops cyprinoides]|uniref:myeloid-associated differentiation marker-like protein 2 n=1 Tax=Megalops cyprinoides TaxID=118141 RepID=UPI001864FED6|nr:myeloid-associated differentiation marker-like protein 2 [Megalops cyprinoides]
MSFGPFKDLHNIFRLVEAIFCTLAACLSSAPRQSYGAWCLFTWVFCLSVSLFILVMEIMSWYLLLMAILPNWKDFTCGMTMLCSLMISSASFIFLVHFTCMSCITAIFCTIFSLAAMGTYMVDAVMAKRNRPEGYLSTLPGFVRVSEAFVACIIFAAYTSYFQGVGPSYRPGAMIWCIIVYGICFLVTVVIILFRLIKFLSLLCSMLDIVELVFNILAVLLYLSTAIVWPLYTYQHYRSYHPPDCSYCRLDDLVVVTVMTIGNLILYIVDLVYSILAIVNRI